MKFLQWPDWTRQAAAFCLAASFLALGVGCRKPHGSEHEHPGHGEHQEVPHNAPPAHETLKLSGTPQGENMVYSGETFYFTLTVTNTGAEDVVTAITSSCGCTKVTRLERNISEGSILPVGESSIRFAISTAGASEKIEGSVTVETASGRKGSAPFVVAVKPGLQVDPANILLEGAPGGNVQASVKLRIPENSEGWKVTEARARNYRLQVIPKLVEGSALDWEIVISWQPGPEASGFMEEILVKTDFPFGREVRFPVEARLKQLLKIEPESWVLGDIHQQGSQEMKFTLESKDGRPFKITQWRFEPGGFANVSQDPVRDATVLARHELSFTVKMEQFAEAMTHSRSRPVPENEPLISHLILETDHPSAPRIKVPIIGVSTRNP